MVKTNNFGKEVYKILISQGIIWILLLLAYIAANVEPSYGVIYDAKKSYMLGYYEKAEGLSYGTELIDIMMNMKIFLITLIILLKARKHFLLIDRTYLIL